VRSCLRERCAAPLGGLAPCGLEMVIMGKHVWRDDPRNSRDFDLWLKANAVLGSILAIGILGMSLAALYSGGRPDKSTEFSSVTKPK
jgi:hypothetical protein